MSRTDAFFTEIPRHRTYEKHEATHDGTHEETHKETHEQRDRETHIDTKRAQQQPLRPPVRRAFFMFKREPLQEDYTSKCSLVSAKIESRSASFKKKKRGKYNLKASPMVKLKKYGDSKCEAFHVFSSRSSIKC